MTKELSKNVRYNLGERTLLLTITDDEGNFVNSHLFTIKHRRGWFFKRPVIVKEPDSSLYGEPGI